MIIHFAATSQAVDWMYSAEAYSESGRRLRITNAFKRLGRCPVHGSPAEWAAGLLADRPPEIRPEGGADARRRRVSLEDGALGEVMAVMAAPQCRVCRRLAERLALFLELSGRATV